MIGGRGRATFSRSSLGFRLGSTLALALLPLGALTIVQSLAAQRELEVSTLDAVTGASLRAVQPQIDLIRDAQVSARTLAAMLTIALQEGGACTERVRSVARSIPEATVVAYIPMGGLMTCASNGRVYDFGDDPLFRKLTERPEPSIIFNPRGPVSGTAVVGIGHPVFDRAGRQTGIVTISLPYYALTPSDIGDAVAGWQVIRLATIERDGVVLISSTQDRDLEAVLPEGVALGDLPGLADSARFREEAGGRHILSVTAVADDLFLVSIWGSSVGGLFDPAGPVAPYLLPGLTWIAALVAAAFASSRLVVRHVRALSRSMSDYLRAGTRMIVPDATDAPAEIQHLHAAYEALVRTIEQEEAELQNLIVDKDRLLREVNHRSGNSLQIIASVMRMYRREAQEPGLQAVLDGLINRVIALSSTHTSLYDLSGDRDIPLNEVLETVISRLKQIHGVSVATTDRRLEPVRTDAQTAVGMALAATEAVNCFFAIPGLESGQVLVELMERDGGIRLRIDGPAAREFSPAATVGIDSLPRRMLQQFAAQLRGRLSIRETAGRTTVELELPAAVAAQAQSPSDADGSAKSGIMSS